MSWIFQESDPMGGAAGEAYANTLKSPGMQPEHVLAREAIQNSVDATNNGAKARVVFRRKVLTGTNKAAFVKDSGIEDIAKRADDLELSTPNCFEHLDKPRKELALLYVEDHNAEGLSGAPHDKNSNFYRLLLSLGDRSKVRTSKGTGGSYGFGKSVYSSSSAIQTIFAYTRFVGDDGREHTRLFGCGYYRSHEYHKKNYSGRAWLGVKDTSDPAGRLVVDPFEDAAADKLAAELGFELRHEGDLGTTILIVDATSDMSAVVAGVEDWWWPRLMAGKLDVEVYDGDGPAIIPRPKKRDDLKPFIEAFELTQGTPPKSGSQKLATLNKLGDLALGTCGFVVAPLNEQGSPTVRSDWCNSVALIRAPLMVVAYKPCSETAPTVVGTFMANDAIDGVLRKSEPPAHDRWDPESENLRDADGSGKKLVGSVLSRIKDNLKRFQREAAPPAPPKQRRLAVLERALGSYFRPQGMGPKPQPEPIESPLHLEFTKQPYAIAADDGMLKLLSAFDIFLDQNAPEDQVDLRLRISCPVLEDEGQEGDDLALTIKHKGVTARVDPEDHRVFHFALAKGAKAHFDIESEGYNPAWTVRLRPEIDAEVTK
ncbi:MAG: hypothetical protein HXY24_12930 [Rubrivivax sp.]|nr:hypothetical protein [Rubrivivax sp.]